MAKLSRGRSHHHVRLSNSQVVRRLTIRGHIDDRSTEEHRFDCNSARVLDDCATPTCNDVRSALSLYEVGACRQQSPHVGDIGAWVRTDQERFVDARINDLEEPLYPREFPRRWRNENWAIWARELAITNRETQVADNIESPWIRAQISIIVNF